MRRDWLRELAQPLFDKAIRPTIYPGARALIEEDRREGFHLVLVSGGLDFALEPVIRYFGFDQAICNRLIFEDNVATGEIARPLIAEREKAAAIGMLCVASRAETAESKAYSDSFSDVPMLKAIGRPAAVNPDRRLKRTAEQHGWPVLDLKKGNHVHRH